MHMKTFQQLWLKRQGASRRLLELERDLAIFVDPSDELPIEDLQDPHGKRFLFDDKEGMAKQTTSAREAILASSLRPSLANQLGWGRVRLRACGAGCACPCGRCAWLRARLRYERWGADLT
jgi:hypothetical protein